jgi:hypothetical protein
VSSPIIFVNAVKVIFGKPFTSPTWPRNGGSVDTTTWIGKVYGRLGGHDHVAHGNKTFKHHDVDLGVQLIMAHALLDAAASSIHTYRSPVITGTPSHRAMAKRLALNKLHSYWACPYVGRATNQQERLFSVCISTEQSVR